MNYVLHPHNIKDSGKLLAKLLKWEAIEVSDTLPDLTGHKVINYGSSKINGTPEFLINNPDAVKSCINKITTLFTLAKFGIPTVEFTQHKEQIPNYWNTIVCRAQIKADNAKGLSFIKKGEPLPDAKLFTKYYDHQHEFRVICLKDKVTNIYTKTNKNGTLEFNSMDFHGFDNIIKQCRKAAEVLKIDFVGFDVLANSQNNFRILEANSGPVFIEDMIEPFKELVK